jgi:hypothetical protein
MMYSYDEPLIDIELLYVVVQASRSPRICVVFKIPDVPQGTGVELAAGVRVAVGDLERVAVAVGVGLGQPSCLLTLGYSHPSTSHVSKAYMLLFT